MLPLLLLPVVVYGFANTAYPMPEYQFSWTANQTGHRLSVQVTLTPPSGSTVGWVGFGIAGGAGGMLGGDMFTAYPTGASCAIQDRRADSSTKALPAQDSSSVDGFDDWSLDSCSLTGGIFTVAASRDFVTYDVHDLDFVSGPMTLLFAWGKTTPTSPTSIDYHDGGHLPVEISLWGEGIVTFNKSALESDYDTQTLSMPAVAIGPGTSYTCKGSNVTQKNGQATQAIAFEPQINAANEPYVHHIVVHSCTNPISETPFSCFSMPPGCSGILYAWGKGGNAFVLPPVTGIAIGSSGRTYVAMQMHYNNPTNVQGLVDSSGVTIYRTNLIRATQSGMFIFGTAQLSLPAHHSVFTVAGACLPANTKNYPASGLNVYSAFFHAHQRGRRIWTNLVRNGSVMGTVGNNQDYDFNLQKVVALTPTVTLLPGDTFITYCTFDTSNDTGLVTWGETTDDEMCINFVAYYPAIGSLPTASCGLTGNPVSAGSPGPTSCVLLPNDPPSAYVLSDLVVADNYYFTSGKATCATGFTGSASLNCAGYGAPYTFSGCVRNSKGSPTPVANSAIMAGVSIAGLLVPALVL